MPGKHHLRGSNKHPPKKNRLAASRPRGRCSASSLFWSPPPLYSKKLDPPLSHPPGVRTCLRHCLYGIFDLGIVVDVTKQNKKSREQNYRGPFDVINPQIGPFDFFFFFFFWGGGGGRQRIQEPLIARFTTFFLHFQL